MKTNNLYHADGVKNILNEASDQWTVKDILLMNKAHTKVLTALSKFDKAVERLQKLSDKNANKPNGKMFKDDATTLTKAQHVINGKFMTAWREFGRGARAAFPKNWN